MPGEGGCYNSPLPHITTLFIITKKGHLTQRLLMDEGINKMSTWWDGSQCNSSLSDAMITHHNQGDWLTNGRGYLVSGSWGIRLYHGSRPPFNSVLSLMLGKALITPVWLTFHGDKMLDGSNLEENLSHGFRETVQHVGKGMVAGVALSTVAGAGNSTFLHLGGSGSR